MSQRTSFTPNEKRLLEQLTSKYPEISSRHADRQSLQRKSDAWQLIHDNFNAKTNFSFKSLKQLKRCWHELNRRQVHQSSNQTAHENIDESNKENVSFSQKVKTEPSSSNAMKSKKMDTFTDEVDKKDVKVSDLSGSNRSNLSELSASFKLQVDDEDANFLDISNESKEVNLSFDEQHPRNASYSRFPSKSEPEESTDDEEDAVKVASYQAAMLSASIKLGKLSKQRLVNEIKKDERANQLHKVNLRTADVQYRTAMIELEIATKKLQQVVTQQY